MNARHSDFITRVEQIARDQIALADRMSAVAADWTAQDLGNTMDPAALTANATTIGDITGAIVTTQAILNLLAAGHRLNLLKVRL